MYETHFKLSLNNKKKNVVIIIYNDTHHRMIDKLINQYLSINIIMT